MSAFILPVLIILLIVYSTIKKNNTYNSFVYGAKTSWDLILLSLPYIVAIFIAVELFEVSGLGVVFSNFVSPFFSFFGIPKELAELVIMKNFTGCGSMALLENVFTTYGVDSYLARAGCAIVGSSEAVFYVTAVYFAKTKVEKFGYAIPVAIICNFLGAVAGCWICKYI